MAVRECSLKVASFNIKWLSERKVHDPDIMTVITKILLRYDLVLILELRSNATDVMSRIVADMNMLSTSPYGFKVSQPLGRTSYKEEYAFVYRFSKVTIQSVEQYDDGPDDHTDAFEREPFIIELRLPNTFSLTTFVFIGVHIKPSDAAAEISHLVDVYRHVAATYHTQNILIAGDMNADCAYMSANQLASSPLHGGNFTWLIDSTADTTVSTHTDCAYDRFIISGGKLKAAIVPGSARPYNFHQTMGLSFNQAWAVSDHYPIELEIV
ncbi:deoxyribonuclease-1-like [Liolophura sinensis]|uniref:deoxyribonuclease-1-like n=1 Tax=Liolophura sinensis TaxID=3198878 RepID=UPI003158BA4D